MRFLALFVVSALTLAPKLSWAVDEAGEISARDYLALIDREVRRRHPSARTEAQIQALAAGQEGYPRLEARDAVDARFRGKFLDCARPDPFADLCETVDELCTASGTDICGGMATGPQLNQPAYRRKVMQHLIRYFSSVTRSNSMQELCCGRDAACRRYFAGVQLFVGREASPHGYFAEFRGDLQRVTVYETSLFRMASEELDESWILHELGHACHWAKGFAGRPAGRQAAVAQFDRAILAGKSAEAAEQARFNAMDAFELRTLDRDPRGRCLREGLQAARANERLRAIPPEWLFEGYPQVLLAPAFSSVFHWYPLCRRTARERHFGRCFVGAPVFRQRYCREPAVASE